MAIGRGGGAAGGGAAGGGAAGGGVPGGGTASGQVLGAAWCERSWRHGGFNSPVALDGVV